jgi:hypothetical protein
MFQSAKEGNGFKLLLLALRKEGANARSEHGIADEITFGTRRVMVRPRNHTSDISCFATWRVIIS